MLQQMFFLEWRKDEWLEGGGLPPCRADGPILFDISPVPPMKQKKMEKARVFLVRRTIVRFSKGFQVLCHSKDLSMWLSEFLTKREQTQQLGRLCNVRMRSLPILGF